ncbi:MAG: MATE family efflux transporter [Halanaerobiales bacterium]
MKISQKENVIDKPVLPVLLKLSWPIMVGESMQLMYNLADTFWVGRLGAEYLAAITVSFPIIFTVFSIGIGFSIAGVALVSQYTGAKQEEKANLATGQIISFSIFISIIFALLGFTFAEELLNLIGAESEVLPLALSYFRIITAGIPLMFLYFIFSSVMQGIGDTKTPMYLKLAAVFANVILDPLLIFGVGFFPELSIAGAAVATVTTRLLAAVAGLYILFSGKKGLKLKIHHLYPNWKMIKKIIKIGFPAAIGDSGLAIGMTVLTSIVAGFGTFTLAAYGVANRITSIIRMPAMGIGRATGVITGQHLGADQPEQAEKGAWLATGIIILVMLIIATIMLFAAKPIVGVFSAEKEVISIGARYLKIVGFAFTFLGAQIVLAGALNGAGKTIQQTFFRLLTLWAFQIPFAYGLAYTLDYGVNGIWWGIFIAKFLGMTLMALWFKRGSWKSKVIEDSPKMTPEKAAK